MRGAHQTGCEISFSRAHMRLNQQRNIKTGIMDIGIKIYHVYPQRASDPDETFIRTTCVPTRDSLYRTSELKTKLNSFVFFRDIVRHQRDIVRLAFC